MNIWMGLLVVCCSPALLLPSTILAQGPPSCQFPFIYKTVTYSSCTTTGDPDGQLWCSTKTDNLNNHLKGNWKHCTPEDVPILPEMKASIDCWTHDKSPGNCISIKQCPSLNSLLLQIKTSPNALIILRKSVCAKEGSTARVCCPSTTTKPTTTATTHTTTKPTTAATTHTMTKRTAQTTRLHPKFPRNCGQSLQFAKIVNGEDATLGAWPWMAIFKAKEIIIDRSCRDINKSCTGWAAIGECQKNSAYMSANCRSSCDKCPSVIGESNWICGGVLINQQYVLTAAHCFKSTTHIEFVRLGEFDLSKDLDTGGSLTAPKPQDIIVERVIKHPKYQIDCERCNDIALTKLEKPAQLHTFFVEPICLPTNPDLNMGFSVSSFQSKLGWATGWGVTDPEDLYSTTGSDILQQVNLTIQELQYCREKKDDYPDGRMILCAGQGDGRDVCRADSGGPLMLSDRYLQKWYVVGITSFGATICGANYAQGIFTSVHHYMDWIHQNI